MSQLKPMAVILLMLISALIGYSLDRGDDDDEDKDGWLDYIEILCGSDKLEVDSVPNDLDGDGICDSLDKDTDGDGILDANDVNPLDPNTNLTIDVNPTGNDLVVTNCLQFRGHISAFFSPYFDTENIPLLSISISSLTLGNEYVKNNSDMLNYTIFIGEKNYSRIVEVSGNGYRDIVVSIGDNDTIIQDMELIGDILFYIVTGQEDSSDNGLYSINITDMLPINHTSQTPILIGNFYGITHNDNQEMFLTELFTNDDEMPDGNTYENNGRVILINSEDGSLIDEEWTTFSGRYPLMTIDSENNLYIVEGINITKITPNNVKSVIYNAEENNTLDIMYHNNCLFFTDNEGLKSLNLSTGLETLEKGSNHFVGERDFPLMFSIDPDGVIFSYYNFDNGIHIVNFDWD